MKVCLTGPAVLVPRYEIMCKIEGENSTKGN